MAVLAFLVAALLWSCGSDSPADTGDSAYVSDRCRAVVDEYWDPLNYLAWRGAAAGNSNFIGTQATVALPCSVYVNRYLVNGNWYPCPEEEIDQYYRTVVDSQFVAGWVDLERISTGNDVQPTQVDFVSLFTSEARAAYIDTCLSGE